MLRGKWNLDGEIQSHNKRQKSLPLALRTAPPRLPRGFADLRSLYHKGASFVIKEIDSLCSVPNGTLIRGAKPRVIKGLGF